MSEITRRDAVRRLALALTGAGLIDRVAAEEIHDDTVRRKRAA